MLGETPRVLIIDDDPLVLRLFTRRLKRRGYEAVLASDEAQARQLLSEQRFALILSDLHLSGSAGGDEICAWMREQGITSPFVLLSGDFVGDVEAELERYPCCDAVLPKPCDLATLNSVLERLLAR